MQQESMFISCDPLSVCMLILIQSEHHTSVPNNNTYIHQQVHLPYCAGTLCLLYKLLCLLSLSLLCLLIIQLVI